MSMTFSTARIGVDTGGTFTDLVLVDNGRITTYKLPSTPDDPSRAVLEGVFHLLGQNLHALVFHGSTVATNALLEGKGADVALLITEGFADLLEIGRQHRPILYAIEPANARQQLARKRIFEVPERIAADGSVIKVLSEIDLDLLVRKVTDAGIKSVALILLHSYANAEHETKLTEALRAKGVRVSASHEVLPEYREFERASTTVVNAMVSPIMERYLDRLEVGLQNSLLKIMQSNGGSIQASTAGKEAVRTILSGPAGGMVGAFNLASISGQLQVMTFDMGGTSTDVGLCDSAIPATSETIIAGWPVKVPMVDIHTVGAGGGSLARIDSGGALRVGPESAGADPGPACYGKSQGVTVTDANLFLGRLLPEYFLAGRMSLDMNSCRTAMERLAKQAGLEPERMAEGIVEVAEATMAGALRVVSVSRGHDPRQFVLVPFGGAGGLHACSLADALNLGRILVPPFPGLLSAVGMVLSDAIRDYSRSVLLSMPVALQKLQELYLPLEQSARRDLVPEKIPEEQVSLNYSLDMRYRGQSYEIEVPFSDNFVGDFHRLHDKRFGYQDASRAVEIVNLRLRAVGDHRHQPFVLSRAGDHEGGPEKEHTIFIDGKAQRCPLYLRSKLGLGNQIQGPALVVEDSATHLIRPGWVGRLDTDANLLLEKTDVS